MYLKVTKHRNVKLLVVTVCVFSGTVGVQVRWDLLLRLHTALMAPEVW